MSEPSDAKAKIDKMLAEAASREARGIFVPPPPVLEPTVLPPQSPLARPEPGKRGAKIPRKCDTSKPHVREFGGGFVVAVQHASGEFTYWNNNRRIWSHTDWYGSRSIFHTEKKAKAVLKKVPKANPFAADAKRLPGRTGPHGPCTPRQAKVLRDRGYDPRNMTRSEAHRIIGEIAASEGWVDKPYPKYVPRPQNAPLDREYEAIVGPPDPEPAIRSDQINDWT